MLPREAEAVDSFAADMTSQAEVRRLALGCPRRLPTTGCPHKQRRWILGTSTPDRRRHRADTGVLNHLAPASAHQPAAGIGSRRGTPARAGHGSVLRNRHGPARYFLDDLQAARKYSGQRASSQSKLANVMFTMELGATPQGSRRSQLPACTQELGANEPRQRGPGAATPRSAAGLVRPTP